MVCVLTYIIYSSLPAVYTKDAFTIDQKIVAYFAFPRLGIAVPLRPGDILIFNPREPHCVSSRCHNSDTVYCVSLYLKSANLGGSDNSKPLNDNEISLLSQFNSSDYNPAK